ncbi:MAG TPA: tetratricopeptide repeat protein, partial [Gammaproteobacteria bacterium]|nr:tetratricopeptide repeat protein [Gammaproteobacteria bacterium]
LKVDPNNLGLLSLDAELLARTGDRAGTKSALDKIVQEYPGNPVGYQGLAGLYLADKRYDDALKEYDRALKVAPKNPELLQQKAAVLAQQQKYAQAAGLLEKIQADYPKSPQGYFQLGELYFVQKDYAKARAQFEDALQRSGKDAAQPLQAIARSYLAEKKPAEAVARVRSFLKDQPDNAYAYDLLGNLYLVQSDYANAAQALHKASALNPSWVNPYVDLSKVHMAQKQPTKAIAVLQRGLKDQPAQLQLLFPLAAIYQESGDPDQSIATYRKVLEASPKNLLATNNLAMLLAGRENDPKGMAEAVSLAKEMEGVRDPAIQDTVGWVYYQSGDASKAVPVLEAVVKAAPKIPIFQYHLGMALYKAGKTRDAKTHLEQALAKGGDFPGAADARKVLAGLK